MTDLWTGLLILIPLLNPMPFGDGPKTLEIVTKLKNYSDLSLILQKKFLLSLMMVLLLVTTSWLENSTMVISNYLPIPSESNNHLKTKLSLCKLVILMLLNGSSSTSLILGNRNKLLLTLMLKELNIKPLLMLTISFLNTSVCTLVTMLMLMSEIQLFVFLLLIKIVGSNLIIMIS
jgi:hypothetical protein